MILLQDIYTYDEFNLDDEYQRALFLILLTIGNYKGYFPFAPEVGLSAYKEIGKFDIKNTFLSDAKSVADFYEIPDYFDSLVSLLDSIRVREIAVVKQNNNTSYIIELDDIKYLDNDIYYTYGYVYDIVLAANSIMILI